MTKGKIPCAVYARVSSDKQAEGDSIIHQVSLAKEYIARQLGEDYYTDESLVYKDEALSGYSTTLLDRPAIQRMFNDAEKGHFKVALFKEISRASRDGEETIKVPRIFETYGVRVIVINEFYDSLQPDTKILLPIQGMLAEKESEKISTRVSSGYREKARSGQWATIAPLGYKINKETKKLEIDEITSDTVKRIFNMYVNERIGTETIAKIFNEEGIKTPRGSIWDKMGVRRILKNEVYAGTVLYGRHRNVIERIYDENKNLVAKKKKMVKQDDFIRVENAHPEIISKEMFLKVEEIMKGRVRGEFKGNRAKHPLVGLLKCAKCGSSFICQAKQSGKYTYRHYKCANRHRFGKEQCDQDIIVADKLEVAIFDILMKKLENISNDTIYAKGIIEIESHQSKIKAFSREKKKLAQKQLQMTKDRDLYTDETFREVMLGLKKDIEHYESQIIMIDSQLKEIGKRNNNYTFLGEVLEKIKTTDINNQIELRAIFHELIEIIEINDKETINNIRYSYNFG